MVFQVFSKVFLFFNKVNDILIADLAYTFPNAIKWFYRVNIKGNISSITLKRKIKTKSKKALLFSHFDSSIQLNKETHAILLLHGIYGHPLSLLHLADIAQEAKIGPVFSIYLPYDEHFPENHRSLLKQAIDEIERMVHERGSCLKGIIATGHSLGAIESAYRAFVVKDERITTVISIAGRLKAVPSPNKNCPECLKSTLKDVYEGILEHTHLPLYQIVAGNDWNAPLEATAVRPIEGSFHIVENAMHLNVLYHWETRLKFIEFLKKSNS